MRRLDDCQGDSNEEVAEIGAAGELESRGCEGDRRTEPENPTSLKNLVEITLYIRQKSRTPKLVAGSQKFVVS